MDVGVGYLIVNRVNHMETIILDRFYQGLAFVMATSLSHVVTMSPLLVTMHSCNHLWIAVYE